jgi:Ca2+-transporting ATPase
MDHRLEWFRKTERQAVQDQRSTLEGGISHAEALLRRQTEGLNVIEDQRRRGRFLLLLAQFNNRLVFVLIVAAVIAGFLGEPEDTIAISLIILLNAILGFVQEYRAEKAMEALQSLAAPQAKVKREGEVLLIPAQELVSGDIVLLESGNSIPADLRLIETYALAINESLLTGESKVVEKVSAPLDEENLPIADQRNMAFKGTLVASGRGVGLVVRTGMGTELGRIAQLLKEEVEVKTPLQRRINSFTQKLAAVVIGVCTVVFGVGLMRGEEPVLMFLTAVSLAVAGIPEALPAIVTVALAIGARVMSRRNALIRKLPAVEALGSVTVICTDKTGTLTENRMQALAGRLGGLSILSDLGLRFSEFHEGDRALFLRVLALNNDITFNRTGKPHGDPTELALAEFAATLGVTREGCEKKYPRILEAGFSSERLMMSTFHQEEEGALLLVKGAPEKVVPLCVQRLRAGSTESFSISHELQAADALAHEGYRVLALAYRRVERGEEVAGDLSSIERDLIFLGLVGLIDPPRPAVAKAIATCHEAGVAVVMITGDHPSTARAMGKKIGILTERRPGLISGQELSQISDESLRSRIQEVSIFARVAPEQKIRIVRALQANGEIVAMTGDGVNDAPALKSADVGISMGQSGTDVAREASHIILLDDHFESIGAAIHEGRRIYDNIRKFVRFALSGNTGEIWTLFLAPFLSLPTPLLPIQILWVNLVTDGLPGLALALEPAEYGVMKRPPRAPQESLFARGLWQHALWVGLLTAAVTLGVMGWAIRYHSARWQSMAFTVLTLVQMGHVLAIRSETESLLRQGIRSNLALLGAVLLTFLLQLGTLYIPALNSIFKTQPLTRVELGVCFLASSLVFLAVELEKAARRWHLERVN